MDVIQERNAANHVSAQLVRDGNIGGILSRTTTAGVAFYGYDGNGNVTLLTNSAGQDVGHYRYDAFGNTLEAEGPRAGENPYRFSTKELHGPSGLYDYGFRFYSPGLGRWMNRDPLEEEGGVNLYAMVGNNPINDVDEYGEVGIKNPYPIFVNWVNGFLEPPKSNPLPDEDPAETLAREKEARDKLAVKSGAAAWKAGANTVMAVAPIPVPKFSKIRGMKQGIQLKPKYTQVNVTRRGTKEGAKALFQRINRRYGNEALTVMRDRATGKVIGLRNQSKTVFYRPKLGKNGQIANVEVFRSGRRIDIHIIR